METNEELQTFIKGLVFVIFSIYYCYLIPVRISSDIPRLLSILPVIATFFILPLPLSTVHLTFPTFFGLVWLANFKLLLLAFNRGPLASKPQLPFLVFIFTALLPINPKKPAKKMSCPDSSDKVDATQAPSHKPMVLAFKAVILSIIVCSYVTRAQPTWEVTCFFVLHGACTAIEVALKKAAKGRFQLHWVVTWQITMAFVLVTFDWLLFHQLIKSGVDVKAIEEISLLVKYVRSKWEVNETNL